jgi:hypothetical protein
LKKVLLPCAHEKGWEKQSDFVAKERSGDLVHKEPISSEGIADSGATGK